MAAEGARRWSWTWVDLLWLIFLAGLAILPPIGEIHKQIILAALAVVQLLETRLLRRWPRRGPVIAVVVKIALATLLIGHTGQVAINSSYYPIFYIPVVTAAMLFGPWGTLGWTAAASAAYCSYLWPALQHYQLVPSALDELALRVFFFFLLALIINRFVMETRRQRDLLLLAREETRRAERLAALGQLSAGLAHEIRNPLAVIKGSAEMLVQNNSGAGEQTRELAGYISSEVNRVNVLVTRFLNFARPLKLQRAPVDVAAVLDQALADAVHHRPEAGIEVARHYAPLPPVEADETLLERAFANLASNAVDAMAAMVEPAAVAVGASASPPRGALSVSAAPAYDAGRAGVLIEFRDTGPGVPAELREQIFNPFFTTKPTGVGLGLAIVAKIMDQHGGYVRLQSPDEGGAAFEVFLPYVHHPDRG